MSTAPFEKDEVYWRRFFELRDDGIEEVSAHGLAKGKSLAEAEMRVTDPLFGRRTSSISRLSHTRRRPSNDNEGLASLPTFRVSDFAGTVIPPREFFVPDLIPKGKVTLLFGDGGTGKSLLALQLAAAAALGEDWLGLPVAQCGALVLAAEDDRDEVLRRLACIVGEDRLARLDRLTVSPLVGIDPMLALPDRQEGDRMKSTPLYEDLRRKLTELQPGLLVLDTLADLFGGDEIKKLHSRGFVALLNRLAAEHGVTIVMLAHPSQAGMDSGKGTSGNSAWSNSVRSRLYLQNCPDETDMRVLTLMKTNYGRTGLKVHMRWQDGYFEHVDQHQQQADDVGEAKREFMRLLAEFTRQGRTVSPNLSPTYAPKQFAAEPDVRTSKQKFAHVMRLLLREGKIVIGETGPPSHRRSFLKVAEHSASEPLAEDYAA